jgi:RNA ligase
MISTPNLWEWNDNDALGCAIRRECRGIAFDVKTGEVISRPYHKFFNVNEKPETQINKINLYESHMILEKLDGSMIRPIKCTDGDFYIATKAGVSEVSVQASNWLRDHSNYYDFMNYIIDDHNSTPIFEWVSRQNGIVIDYPEDNLILTGIRSNKTGKYFKYDDLKYYGSLYGIDIVNALHQSESNIGPLVHTIKKWVDAEGIVIRFDDGHMLKIKADDYILRHYAKESINHEKNLIGLILADGLDDLIPVLHENDQKRVSDFEKAFHANIHDTAMNIHDMYGEYVRNYALSDKKDFAVNFALKKEKKYQQFLFGLHRGDYNLLDALYKTVENSISSSSRVENVRWIFANLRF